MIGVFKDGKRIGSLLKFNQRLPWVAYASEDRRQSFKLKREAVAWLASLAV